MIKAYIDFQNVSKWLERKASFDLTDINIHDLLDEIAEGLDETCVKMHRAYSGLPSKKVDEIARNRQIGIFTAMRHRQGVDVFTRNLAYRYTEDGKPIGREKGIDVRLSCELVADVAYGEITGALIWSWDQDLSEAVRVAKQLAESQGREFKIYSIELDIDASDRDPNTKLYPIHETIPVKLTRTMLYRHLRFTDDEETIEVTPLDLVAASANQFQTTTGEVAA